MRHIKTDSEERVETCAVQFNDDWPGLFVRGDDCLVLVCILEELLDTARPCDKQLVKDLYHCAREAIGQGEDINWAAVRSAFGKYLVKRP